MMWVMHDLRTMLLLVFFIFMNRAEKSPRVIGGIEKRGGLIIFQFSLVDF